MESPNSPSIFSIESAMSNDEDWQAEMHLASSYLTQKTEIISSDESSDDTELSELPPIEHNYSPRICNIPQAPKKDIQGALGEYTRGMRSQKKRFCKRIDFHSEDEASKYAIPETPPSQIRPRNEIITSQFTLDAKLLERAGDAIEFLSRLNRFQREVKEFNNRKESSFGVGDGFKHLKQVQEFLLGYIV